MGSRKVNLGFAVELGFKVLLHLAGNPKRGHDLADLFHALPPAQQGRMIAGSQLPLDVFEHRLKLAATTFESWRYLHEDKNVPVGAEPDFLLVLFSWIERELIEVHRLLPDIRATTNAATR